MNENESGCCKEHHHKYCEKGHLVLSAGHHEIFVETECQSEKVFLCGNSCHQVCESQIDLYASEVVPDGFKLFAEVKNPELKIEWISFC